MRRTVPTAPLLAAQPKLREKKLGRPITACQKKVHTLHTRLSSSGPSIGPLAGYCMAHLVKKVVVAGVDSKTRNTWKKKLGNKNISKKKKHRLPL